MDSGEPFYDSSCHPPETKNINQLNLELPQEKKEITSVEQKEEITLELRQIIAREFQNNEQKHLHLFPPNNHLILKRDLSPIIETKKN